MPVDASNRSNNNGLLGTLRRSLTLKRSQNRFSLNPEDHATQKTEFISNTVTLGRTSTATESSQFGNRTQNLGSSLSESLTESALDQARKLFGNNEMSNEPTNVSEKSHINTNLVRTIRACLKSIQK